MAKEKLSKVVPDKEFIQSRLDYLFQMADEIVTPKLKIMCMIVLNDGRFQKCTAARSKHQAYAGGLVVHTAEVLEAALQLATCRHLKINYDVLVTATIFHDYGKIWDYAKKTVKILENDVERTEVISNEYDYTSHQEYIRHLSRSYAEFMIMNNSVSGPVVGENIVQDISHCILAHHGRHEWGSPTEPISTEAHIIHFSDMLSAHCSLPVYPV